MTEQEFVKKCLEQICIKNGFGEIQAMTQRDYELISREIEEKTSVLISVSTIKRLLKGEFSRIPQTATLNAIAAYMGYKNWQEYKTLISKDLSPIAEKKTEKPISLIKKSRTFLNWNLIIILIITIGVTLFLSFSKSVNKPSPKYEKASFSVTKITNNSIPNSVVFNYNIDEVEADSFFIQQSWDKRTRVKIDKHTYTLTDIYYEPGYHIAKLIANDSIIKTIDISIPTDKWMVYVKGLGAKSIPQYLPNNSLFKNGYLTLEKTAIDEQIMKSEEKKYFFYMYFPSKMEMSSDNFSFKTRVRVKDAGTNQCPFIMTEVFCQRRYMYIRSMPKGCASETDAQFSETMLSGKKTDLSSLCYDVSQWADIELRVKNKQVSVFINQQKVYTSAYKISSKLITGLGFISNSICEIDKVKLSGLDGKLVYESDFDGEANKTK